MTSTTKNIPWKRKLAIKLTDSKIPWLRSLGKKLFASSLK
jgi:hypothetical protein